MIKVNYVKLILSTIVFFVAIFFSSHMLYEQQILTLIFKCVLVLSITYIYWLFLSKDSSLPSILKSIILLLSAFEIYKFVEHKMGFLPRYTDAPFYINILFSIVAVSLYVLLIVMIARILKK